MAKSHLSPAPAPPAPSPRGRGGAARCSFPFSPRWGKGLGDGGMPGGIGFYNLPYSVPAHSPLPLPPLPEGEGEHLPGVRSPSPACGGKGQGMGAVWNTRSLTLAAPQTLAPPAPSPRGRGGTPARFPFSRWGGRGKGMGGCPAALASTTYPTPCPHIPLSPCPLSQRARGNTCPVSLLPLAGVRGRGWGDAR